MKNGSGLGCMYVNIRYEKQKQNNKAYLNESYPTFTVSVFLLKDLPVDVNKGWYGSSKNYIYITLKIV